MSSPGRQGSDDKINAGRAQNPDPFVDSAGEGEDEPAEPRSPSTTTPSTTAGSPGGLRSWIPWLNGSSPPTSEGSPSPSGGKRRVAPTSNPTGPTQSLSNTAATNSPSPNISSNLGHHATTPPRNLSRIGSSTPISPTETIPVSTATSGIGARQQARPTSSGRASEGGAPGDDSDGTGLTRSNTGLSIATGRRDGEIELQAIGEHTPIIPGRAHGRRPHPHRPHGLRTGGARGDHNSLPTTPVDPTYEITRRNRAFLAIYERIRSEGVIPRGHWDQYMEDMETVRKWRFQLGVNTMGEMAEEGVVSMRDFLATAAADVSEELRTQILQLAQTHGERTRDTVNAALNEERLFIDRTAESLVNLIESPTNRGRSSSSPRSLASESSQLAGGPLDRRNLMRNSKEDLIQMLLDREDARREAEQRVGELEDEAAEQAETNERTRREHTAQANHIADDYRRQIANLEADLAYEREAHETAAVVAPTEQDPVSQASNQSSNEESPRSSQSRSTTASRARSPARERAFEELRTALGRIDEHEALLREYQERAGLNPGLLEFRTTPWTANAQTSKTRLLIQIRDTERERDRAIESENQLRARNEELESALRSPGGRRAALLVNLLNSARSRSSGDVSSRSTLSEHSASTGFAGVGGQNLMDELQGVAEQQANAAWFQQFHIIPEWLATHPNSPCDNCRPVLRFPPGLAEGACHCTCDFAARDEESPQSRTSSSARSVRFAGVAAPRGILIGSPSSQGRRTAERRPNPPELTAVTTFSASGSPRRDSDDSHRPGTPYPRRGCRCCGDGGPQIIYYTCGNMAGEQAEAPPVQGLPMTLYDGLMSLFRSTGSSAPSGPPSSPSVASQYATPPVGLANLERGPDVPQTPSSASTASQYATPPAGLANTGRDPVVPWARRNTDPPDLMAPIAEAGPRDARAQTLSGGIGAAAGPELPQGPEIQPPQAPGPAPHRAPAGAPGDPLLMLLAFIWNIFCSLTFVQLHNMWLVLYWILSSIWYYAQLGLYLNLRYVAHRHVLRPRPSRLPTREITVLVKWLAVVWFLVALVALDEEKRIWNAANPQLTAAYFRGLPCRTSHQWWAPFQVDYALLEPAFGRLSKWLHTLFLGAK